MKCRKCKEPRRRKDFYTFKSGRLKGRRRTICIPCCADNRRSWRASVPGGYGSLRRARNYWKKYGLTLEKLEALLEKQGNRCAICRREFSSTLLPQVDHKHSTGKIRGLLCMNCNTALPLLELHLEEALTYLKEELEYMYA